MKSSHILLKAVFFLATIYSVAANAAETATGTVDATTTTLDSVVTAQASFTMLNTGANGTITFELQSTSLVDSATIQLTAVCEYLPGSSSAGQPAASGVTFGNSSVTVAKGSTNSTYVIAGTDSCSATITYTLVTSNVADIDPFNFLVTDSPAHNAPLSMWTTSSTTVIVSLGGVVPNGQELSYTISTGGLQGVTVTGTPSFFAGSDTSSFTLTTGTFNGTLTLTFVPAGSGTATFAETFEATIAVAQRFTMSHNASSQMYFDNVDIVNVTLGTPLDSGETLTLSVASSGGATGSALLPCDPVPLAFSNTMSWASFSVSTGQVFGTLTLSFSLSGSRDDVYAVPADHVVVVSPRSQAVTTLTPMSPWTNQAAKLCVNLGNKVPVDQYVLLKVELEGESTTSDATEAGATSSSDSSDSSGDLLTFSAPNLTIASGLSVGCIDAMAGASAGSANVSVSLSGPAARIFLEPMDLNVTVRAQNTISVANGSTSLYQFQQSMPFNMTLSAAIPTDGSLTVKVSKVGDAASGTQVTPSDMLVFDSMTQWNTFNITAGVLVGDFTLTYDLSGPSKAAYVVPESSTVSVMQRSTISSDLSVKVSTSATTNVTLSLSNASMAAFDIMLTLTGDATDTTLSTSTVSVWANATNATFSIVGGATTGVATLTYKLMGSGAAQFQAPSAQTFVVIAAGQVVLVSPTSVLFQNQRSERLTLVLGTAVPSGSSTIQYSAQITAACATGDTTCPGVTASPSSVSFPGDGTTDTKTFRLTAGTYLGLVTITMRLTATSTDYSDAAPITILVRSLIQKQSSIPSTVVAEQTATGMFAITQPVPINTDLFFYPVLTGTAAANATVQPSVIAFGGDVSTQTFSVTTATTLQDLTVMYTFNGSASYAVDPVVANDTIIVSSNLTVTPPSSILIDSMTDAFTFALSHPIPSGLTLTLGVSTTSGAELFTDNDGQGMVVNGTSIDFVIGCCDLSYSATIQTLGVPGEMNLTITSSGTAAPFVLAPSVLPLVVQAKTSFSPNVVTVTQGGSSSKILVTLDAPVPAAASEDADASQVWISFSEASGVAAASVLPNPAGVAFQSGEVQKTVRIESDASQNQVGPAQLRWSLTGDQANKYVNPGILTVLVQGIVGVNQSQGLKATTSEMVNLTLSAPVPEGRDLTVNIAASTASTTISPSSVVFMSGNTTGNFTLTAPASTSVVTLTYTLSGQSQDFYTVTSEVLLLVAAANQAVFATPASMYSGACEDVPVFLGTAVTTTNLTLTPTVPSTMTITPTSVTIPSGGDSATFKLCDVSSVGSVTITMASDSTSYTISPASRTITVEALVTASYEHGITDATIQTGSTTALTATLTQAAPNNQALTIRVSPSLPQTVINNAPIVFQAGQTSATFSLSSGYKTGTQVLTYEVSGALKAAVNPGGPTVFTVAYPSPASFVYSSISENSAVQGAFNKLTVTIEPSQPLTSDNVIEISNLYYSTLPAEGVVVTGTGLLENRASLIGEGNGALQIRIKKNKEVPAGTNTTFSFYLDNADAAVTPAASVMIAVRVANGNSFSSDLISATAFKSNVGANGGEVCLAGISGTFSLRSDSSPLLRLNTATQTATSSSITESTAVNGAMNTLTVSLKTSSNIAAGSTISLCGFYNTTTAPTVSLPVAGQHGANVGNVAELRIDRDSSNVESFTVVFYVETDLPTSTTAAQLSFALRNPLQSQTALSIVVSTGTSNTPVAPTTLMGTVFGAGGLPSGALSGSVAESSKVQGATNTLTFTLTPSASVPSGSVIVIGNLSNAIDAPQDLALTTASTALASTCKYSLGTAWCMTTGSLALNTAFSFTLNLQNPKTNLTANTIWASVNGTIPFDATQLTGTVLTATNTPSTVWDVATVEQSNMNTNMPNTLKFCLRPSSDLPYGTVLTIGQFSTNVETANSQSQVQLVVEGTTGGADFNTVAKFANRNLIISLTSTSSTIPASRLSCFSVTLTNPSTTSASASTLTISEANNLVASLTLTTTVMQPTAVPSTVNGNYQPKFSAFKYYQSSRIASADNNVQLCFTPTLKIDAGSTLQFAFGTTPGPNDNTMFPIMGESGYFGGTGKWTRVGGTLQVTVTNTIPIASKCIYFTLRNPSETPTTTRTVTLSTSNVNSGSTFGLTMTTATASGASTANCPFGALVSGTSFPHCGGTMLVGDKNAFVQADMVQENATCSSGGCLIKLYIRPAADLAAGSSFTITGLTHATATTAAAQLSLYQSNTATGALAINDTAAACNGTMNSADAGMFGATSAWVKDGNLTMTIASGKTLVATRTLCVELSIRRPAQSGSIAARVQIGSDTQSNVSVTSSGVWEQAASPALVSTNPSPFSTDVPAGSTIALEFDHRMQIGGVGTARFILADGTQLGSSIQCTSSETRIIPMGDGSVVGFSIPNAGTTVVTGSVRFEMDSGCLAAVSAQGNQSFPGVSGATLTYYLPGGTEPTIKSRLVGDSAAAFANRGHKSLIVNFRSNIAFNGGNARVYRATDFKVLATIPLTTTTTLKQHVLKQNYATVYNSTLNMTLAADVLATPGTCVYVAIPRGSIVDNENGKSFAGITRSWRFCVDTADSAPALSTTMPTLNEAGVRAGSTSLRMDFTTSIAAGSGQLQLHRSQSTTATANPKGAVATFSCADLSVASRSATLTVPSSALQTTPSTSDPANPPSLCFYVVADAGCVVNKDNNAAWGGIMEADQWRFCIASGTALDVVRFAPLSGDSYTGVAPTMQFNKQMQRGMGSISLWQTQKAGAAKLLATVDVADTTKVTLTSTTFAGLPSSIASFNFGVTSLKSDAYITVCPTCFTATQDGTAYSGFTDTTTWRLLAQVTVLSKTTCGQATTASSAGCVSASGTSLAIPTAAYPAGIDSISIAEEQTSADAVPETEGDTLYAMSNIFFLGPTGTKWLRQITACFKYNCELNSASRSLAFVSTQRQVRKQITNANGIRVWSLVPSTGQFVDSTDSCKLCGPISSFSRWRVVAHQAGSTPSAPAPPGSPTTPSTPSIGFFSAATTTSSSWATIAAMVVMSLATLFFMM